MFGELNQVFECTANFILNFFPPTLNLHKELVVFGSGGYLHDEKLFTTQVIVTSSSQHSGHPTLITKSIAQTV